MALECTRQGEKSKSTRLTTFPLVLVGYEYEMILANSDSFAIILHPTCAGEIIANYYHYDYYYDHYHYCCCLQQKIVNDRMIVLLTIKSLSHRQTTTTTTTVIIHTRKERN